MMQRPTGGPDREQYRPPTREQLAAERRGSLRRLGWGLGIGGVAVAALGAFVGFDSTNHGLGEQTVVQHVLSQISYDDQFKLGVGTILVGGFGMIPAGIGLVSANQEPSRF